MNPQQQSAVWLAIFNATLAASWETDCSADDLTEEAGYVADHGLELFLERFSKARPDAKKAPLP